jgi:hypothetical protein
MRAMDAVLLCLTIVCGTLGALCSFAVAKDTKAPTIQITSPTSSTTYVTTATSVTISGTAKDPGGAVTQVTWATNQGSSGTATGTTSWTFGLTLAVGTTQVSVTAHDAAGNVGTDSLTITVMGSPPPQWTLAWDDMNTQGDAFQVSRCQIESCSGTCAMQPIATIAPTDRTWTDTQVQSGVHYQYEIAMMLGGTVGPFSNIACTP